MEEQFFYKVVRDDRKSATTFNPEFVVDYTVGKRSYPQVEGTPLFVYRTLGDAVRCWGDYVIFKCRVGPEIHKDHMCGVMTYEGFTPQRLFKFWNDDEFVSDRKKIDPDIALVEWVELVELVVDPFELIKEDSK